jgi:superfamily II DNA or RNA helicase
LTRPFTMSELLPGTEVQARGLRWEVVFSQGLGSQFLYRLRSLEHGLRGQELDLLTPLERIEPVIREIQPDRAAPLRNWLVYHQAFLLEQALGPHALLAGQPGRLRIEPYQLVPVLRAIRTSRARLMLADGVGLGKTVQAGLVLTELMARRLAHRVLIVSPAGPLLDQWKVEMGDRFGLRMEVIDRGRLEEIRRNTELGANPFDHISLGLASIDFLKQERVLELLDRTAYDVIVIDEAHHCTELGDMDREDSQRRRLAEVLSRRSDAFLLLTATPHDGNDRSFASLCELLDPSLVDGRGALRGERYRPYVVRRLKQHVPGFRERDVLPIQVAAEPSRHSNFIALQRALLDLVAPELRRAFRTRRYADVLAFIALLKRSVSTVEALRSTLNAVANRFQDIVTRASESQQGRRERLRTLRDYYRKLERFGTVTAEEEADRHALEAEDLAHQLAELERQIRSGSRDVAKVSNIVEALDALIQLADRAVDEDPKLERVIAEIAAVREAEPRASVLIYTEYIASQLALTNALRRAGIDRVLTMNGDDDEATRKLVTSRFRSEDDLVVVSTDSAAEGLNLHARCHHLIHLELPFNPNRLEQRNGRIDRYGQQKDSVVRYLYLRGTFEERILLRLIAKYERQRRRLTFVPNTLGLTTSNDASAARLLKGLLDEDTRLFKTEHTFDFESPDEESADDAATRELLEEIDNTLKGFEQAARTHVWLGEAGLNAQGSLMTEADRARAEGIRTGGVDLASFVCDAVQLDGGRVEGDSSLPVFSLTIPAAWTHGLDGLTGYEPEARIVRVTTHIDVMKDAENRPVGFLGRSHPLVRRALDRVRNLAFGGGGTSGQDPRASAVVAEVDTPTMICTFVGRVSSRAGREFERVLAMEATSHGALRYLTAPEEWLVLAQPARALRTRDVWSAHFEAWAPQARAAAEAAVKDAFKPIAEEFIADWRAELTLEMRLQDEWLQQRAVEIIGDRGAEAPQPNLFESGAAAGSVAAWNALANPHQRLAGFAADRAQLSALRSAAESVLRLYRQRKEALEARADLRREELIPVGLLMVLPKTASDGA